MLILLVIGAVLMLSSKGTDGQEIDFDPLSHSSPCNQSLRSGTDNFTFTGTVGRDYNTLVGSGWSTSVAVQISVSSSAFVPICEIFIGNNAVFCKPQSLLCYCSVLNATTGSAHVLVNYPAQLNYSQGIIRAEWINNNGAVRYSNTITLPAIYDVKKPTLKFYVNGQQSGNTSTLFGMKFEENKTNTVQLCCSDTATPCYPRMSLDGQVVDSQTDCVSHTVFASNVNYTASVTLSYAVCDNNYIIAESGVIETKEKSVDTTTIETTTETTSIPDVTTSTLVPSSSTATITGVASTTVEPTNETTAVSADVTTPIPTLVSSGSTATVTVSPTPSPHHLKDWEIALIIIFAIIGAALLICGILAAISKCKKGVWCYYLCYYDKTLKKCRCLCCDKTSVNTTSNAKSADSAKSENMELKVSNGENVDRAAMVPNVKAGQAAGKRRDSGNNTAVPASQYSEHTNHGYDGRRTSPSNIIINEAKETTNDNFQQNNTARENDNNKHFKDKTNEGHANQMKPKIPRALPPITGTTTHGQQQATGQPRPTSIEITSSPAVKPNKK